MNLDKSIYSEVNISKKPALELLQAMGYTYLSPEECRQQRGSGYRVLLRDVLRGQLRKLNRYTYGGAENEFSAVNIEHAMDDLEIPLPDGLVGYSGHDYGSVPFRTLGEEKKFNPYLNCPTLEAFRQQLRHLE